MKRVSVQYTKNFFAIAASVSVLSLVTVTACSDGRSADAFCSTMESEQTRILNQFNEAADAAGATSDGFAAGLMGIGAGIQALGELRTYFEKLAKVAPAEIQTEAEIVADEMSKMTDAPELSIEGIASSVFGGFAISGPLNTLEEFAAENCGEQV